MPTAITLQLDAAAPLFFDETWPLEELFLGILGQAGEAEPDKGKRETPSVKPYALSPIRRAQGRRIPAGPGGIATAYQWRICLLDDALAPRTLSGLETTQSLSLGDGLLTISGVSIQECTYPDIAQQAQAQIERDPDRERHIGLELLTPAILYRSGLPMPLPEPALVFEHYLRAWDTFAPRELQVNFNLLDAVAYHVAVTEHRLATQRVRLAGGGTRIGCLGNVSYTVMNWQKLGAEFLARLHMLARFAEFCGTGELTESGLGQTRYELTI